MFCSGSLVVWLRYTRLRIQNWCSRRVYGPRLLLWCRLFGACLFLRSSYSRRWRRGWLFCWLSLIFRCPFYSSLTVQKPNQEYQRQEMRWFGGYKSNDIPSNHRTTKQTLHTKQVDLPLFPSLQYGSKRALSIVNNNYLWRVEIINRIAFRKCAIRYTYIASA